MTRYKTQAAKQRRLFQTILDSYEKYDGPTDGDAYDEVYMTAARDLDIDVDELSDEDGDRLDARRDELWRPADSELRTLAAGGTLPPERMQAWEL